MMRDRRPSHCRGDHGSIAASLSCAISYRVTGEDLPNHAEVMARALADNGVEYLFGLPGGEITAFWDACRPAGIRFVLAAHETSAAMMAQVMGELTGRPGACAATLGP